MTEFHIPISPEDLQTRANDFPLALSSEPDIRFSDDLAERVIHDLGFDEPCCILEQSQFDAVYIIIREFESLGVELQNGLTEEMNSNLKVLSTLTSAESEEMKMQRSAIKAYVFFVNWIWIKAEKQYQTSQQEQRTDRGRASIAHAFDWKTHMEGTMSAIAVILSLDLSTLFQPSGVDHRLLDLCLTMGTRCLENWEVLRCAGLKDHVFRIFASCAVRHGVESATAASLLLTAQKADQLPPIVAEIAQFSGRTYDDDALTIALVQEITKGSPHHYSSQWEASKGRSQAIKSLSKLLECLGDAVPIAVLKQSSALEPYWCCSAYPFRSALVSVLGELILAVAEQEAPDREQQQHQMLDRLIQRFADTNAFTRSRCFAVWIRLTQKGCVPIEYWLDVTRWAYERLQDCASTVRKSSLCLLQALIEYNPFGDNMNTERFRGTLDLYKKRLQEYPPAQREIENGDAERESMDGQDDDRRQSSAEACNYRQLCFVVQNLETASRFTECLTETLDRCPSLLSSTSVTVAQEVIHYLIVCKRFSVNGVDAALRTSFALIFSREPTLKEEIQAAFLKLYSDEEDDLITAQNLVLLAVGATVGEMACLEEILETLLLQDKLPAKVVKALILIALDKDTMPIPIPTQTKVRGAVFLLSVCAPHCRELMAQSIDSLLQIGFVDTLSDGECVGLMCRVLKSIGASDLDEEAIQDVCCSLVQIVFEQHMPNEEWFEVAENAVGTLYTLFPNPDELFEEILQSMTAAVLQQGNTLQSSTPLPRHSADRQSFFSQENGHIMEDDRHGVQSDAFLRFHYLLGQVAVHHMAYVEICADAALVRISDLNGEDLDKDDAMGEVTNQQEFELDSLKQNVCQEVLDPSSLIGHYAPTVSRFCHSLVQFVEAPVPVQIAMSLTLVKLMSIDFVFCQDNIRLLFTLLQNQKVESIIKENLVVHLSDLIIRFPNLIEPWTPNIYDLLSSNDAGVKRNALLVLTHLILSDMIKVKGHISKMIIHMRADDERLRSMATSFVNELARKATRTSNPIYNLFPDVLSNLLQESSLQSQDFQAIIQYLLKFTKWAGISEKHGEKLVEKLCLRFETEERVKVWRGLTFSIKSLQLGEKGFRKLTEMVKHYRRSLADEQSFRHLKDACAKVKRNAKSNELKSLVQIFETDLTTLFEELRGDVDMETEPSVANSDDLESELTFAEMGGNGATLSSTDDAADVLKSSDRKRKAAEQDALDRRSEIRLVGRTSRLDRIPERNASTDSTFTGSLPPAGEALDRESSKKLPLQFPLEQRKSEIEKSATTPENTKNQSRHSETSPEMERRLSRLSISKDADD